MGRHIGRDAVDTWAVAIYDIALTQIWYQSCIRGFSSSGIPGLGSSWSFLTRHIIFSKALLSRLALPVIIANAASLENYPAAKLPKHGSRRHNRDLSRAIGVRQNVLLDQGILLCLARNDFIKRSILVKEEIRVSIS